MPKLQNSTLSTSIGKARRHIDATNRPMRKTLSISFGLRQVEKMPLDKMGYIYMWLRYGSKRIAFSTGIKASPRAFDQKTTVIAGNVEATAMLTALRHKAEAFSSDLKLTGRAIVRWLRKSAHIFAQHDAK